MDGEEDCRRKKGAQGSSHQSQSNVSNSLSVSGEEADWEGALSTEKHGDLGDMTFCMANYVKEAMKMMFMMRSHHMLTDVILEVGTELFHAHKVILAAASPYFKVSLVLIWEIVLISVIFSEFVHKRDLFLCDQLGIKQKVVNNTDHFSKISGNVHRRIEGVRNDKGETPRGLPNCNGSLDVLHVYWTNKSY